ncbi:MAG: hypothetical protein ABR586_09695, partial [Thermoplasmatota archaeon]
QECPTHWHATFAVHVPGPNGTLERVDMATPRALNGKAYYDLSGGAGMGFAVHMHQSGPEQGSGALGPTQLHFEQPGTCVTVKETLHALEMDAATHTLKLSGAHAQAHQDHTWTDNGTARLRWFVQFESGGAWEWQERAWAEVQGMQLPDGSSLLVAFGNPTAAQVAEMQAGIPAPISRAPPA